MKSYVAELIGTFVLVFGGCGAAVLAGSHIGFTGVAFAFGFSLLVMVYAIGLCGTIYSRSPTEQWEIFDRGSRHGRYRVRSNTTGSFRRPREL
jgi:Major intrinsic protein